MSINLETQPIPVLFAKKGGTWDMDMDQEGHLIGVGNLGDAEIKKLMEQRGLLERLPRSERLSRERDFAVYLYNRFQGTEPLDIPVEKYLESWCPEFGRYVTGPFYPFFSGDSSHFTHPFNAAITTNLVERRIQDPRRVVLGAEGTDAADIAFLNLNDVLTFDTELPPETFTGANKSRHESGTDAPGNFLRLAKLVAVDPLLYLPDPQYSSGSFWSFHKYLYSGADVVKFDPKEERLFEGQDTFFSPNAYVHLDDDTLSIFRAGLEDGVSIRRKEKHPYHQAINAHWLSSRNTPPPTHISRQLSTERLYNALTSVYTVDLGSQNLLADEIEKILDPSYRAIVVAAHGLGNGPLQLRAALIEAAKQDKIIIITSRAFIPSVNQRYAESLLGTNFKQDELGMLRYSILSGEHLSKTAARAIAVRAILEGLSQVQTKQLLTAYLEARPPQYGKELDAKPALVTAGSSGRRGGVALMEKQESGQVDDLEDRKLLAEDFVNIWSHAKATDLLKKEAIDYIGYAWELITAKMALTDHAKDFLFRVLVRSIVDNYSPIGMLPLAVLDINPQLDKLGLLAQDADSAKIEADLISYHQQMMDADINVISTTKPVISMSGKLFETKYMDPEFHKEWVEEYQNKYGTTP